MRTGLWGQVSTAALTVLMAVGVAVTPALAAEPADDKQAGGEPVKVIVNLHQPAGAAAVQAVEAAGGRVRHSYQLINAVSATLPGNALAGLSRNRLVKSVELDYQIVAFHHDADTGNPELEAAWGVEHIGAGDVHLAGNTGAGVKVGVIDTGIDYTHPDLNSLYAGGWDFYNNDADPFDDHGHGTHVSGSLAAELNSPPAGVVGVAPSVQLFAYKVLGADGSGDYSYLIAALERAALVDQVDVVNMSLGGKAASDALQAAVVAAYEAGVILVAASGNVNPFDIWELLFGCPVAYPARYEQVFATTFTGQNNELTGYSCTGPEVDFAAPGDLIYSTVPTGDCPLCAPSGYRGDVSGTSMASPHLAGTVALVLAHGIANEGDPATRADDVKAHLCATTMLGFGVLTTAISPDDPRYAQYFGCGVVDAKTALVTNPPGSGGGGDPGGPGEPGDPTPTPTPTPDPTPTPTADPTPTPTPDPTPTPTADPTPAPTPDPTPTPTPDPTPTPTADPTPAPTPDPTPTPTPDPTPTPTPTATPTPTPTPSPAPTAAPATMHVADLAGSATRQGNGWTARVTILVHDAGHEPLSGVTVSASWSTGHSGSCRTNGAGVCTISLSKLSTTLASVSFSVTGLSRSGWTYDPLANHDADGDSDGTTIVVLRP